MLVQTRRQIARSLYLAVLTVGVTAVLIGNGGGARAISWVANSLTGPGEILVPAETTPAVADGTRAGPRCPECGVIVSVRQIEIEEVYRDDAAGAAAGPRTGGRSGSGAKPAGTYHILVRMADGSSRVIENADPASWRAGDRVIVIDGAKSPTQ